MKSVVSIRIPNEIIHDLETISKELHISRNEYIKSAIQVMNDTWKENERKKKK